MYTSGERSRKGPAFSAVPRLYNLHRVCRANTKQGGDLAMPLEVSMQYCKYSLGGDKPGGHQYLSQKDKRTHKFEKQTEKQFNYVNHGSLDAQ
jgi:hypothetical protein